MSSLSPVSSQQVKTVEPTQSVKASVPLPSIAPVLTTTAQEMVTQASTSLQQVESSFIQQTIGPNPFFIDAAKVNEIRKRLSWDNDKILRHMVTVAKSYARPQVSNFYVGAAAIGESGAIYLGVNLEFKDCSLSHTVHAEQFLVANARNKGEKNLTTIAISAAPCGHCRQFLNEIENGKSIKILYQKPNGGPVISTLGDLFPDAFGPQDLGIKGGLLGATFPVNFHHEKILIAKAIQAAHGSYSPYSKSLSGVAFKTKENKYYVGSYLENVGFNPSLSPFLVALVAFVSDLGQYEEITRVVIVEDKPMHAKEVELILAQIAPKAKFHALPLYAKALAKS